MAEMRFEEKILYKTRQHWIIPLAKSLKLLLFIILPVTIALWFVSDYSLVITTVGFLLLAGGLIGYEHYLWHHSWLFVGNQKVTLSVRNGIFSQYAMNIRYRNIRDSAVSKNSLLGFLLKYGTLFIRSTNAEGDFTAKYVPKVGKIYALINALSRYNDDERAHIESIEKLHEYHISKEFTPRPVTLSLDAGISIVKGIPGVLEVIELEKQIGETIAKHEEPRNQGVHEVLKRKHRICFLHDSNFRLPEDPIVHHLPSGEVVFPPVPFPELVGSSVVSGSPGIKVHDFLLQYFPYASPDAATVLVGWDD